MTVSRGSRVWQWNEHSPSAEPSALSFFVEFGARLGVSRVAQLQLSCGKDSKVADPPKPDVIGAWKDLGKRHFDHRDELLWSDKISQEGLV